MSIISAQIWVHNQPFAYVDRISKTLLRSSCVHFTAKTAISVLKKQNRAAVCGEHPFRKDPRFISEVDSKMTIAKNLYCEIPTASNSTEALTAIVNNDRLHNAPQTLQRGLFWALSLPGKHNSCSDRTDWAANPSKEHIGGRVCTACPWWAQTSLLWGLQHRIPQWPHHCPTEFKQKQVSPCNWDSCVVFGPQRKSNAYLADARALSFVLYYKYC